MLPCKVSDLIKKNFLESDCIETDRKERKKKPQPSFVHYQKHIPLSHPKNHHHHPSPSTHYTVAEYFPKKKKKYPPKCSAKSNQQNVVQAKKRVSYPSHINTPIFSPPLSPPMLLRAFLCSVFFVAQSTAGDVEGHGSVWWEWFPADACPAPYESGDLQDSDWSHDGSCLVLTELKEADPLRSWTTKGYTAVRMLCIDPDLSSTNTIAKDDNVVLSYFNDTDCDGPAELITVNASTCVPQLGPIRFQCSRCHWVFKGATSPPYFLQAIGVFVFLILCIIFNLTFQQKLDLWSKTLPPKICPCFFATKGYEIRENGAELYEGERLHVEGVPASPTTPNLQGCGVIENCIVWVAPPLASTLAVGVTTPSQRAPSVGFGLANPPSAGSLRLGASNRSFPRGSPESRYAPNPLHQTSSDGVISPPSRPQKSLPPNDYYGEPMEGSLGHSVVLCSSSLTSPPLAPSESASSLKESWKDGGGPLPAARTRLSRIESLRSLRVAAVREGSVNLAATMPPSGSFNGSGISSPATPKGPVVLAPGGSIAGVSVTTSSRSLMEKKRSRRGGRGSGVEAGPTMLPATAGELTRSQREKERGERRDEKREELRSRARGVDEGVGALPRVSSADLAAAPNPPAPRRVGSRMDSGSPVSILPLVKSHTAVNLSQARDDAKSRSRRSSAVHLAGAGSPPPSSPILKSGHTLSYSPKRRRQNGAVVHAIPLLPVEDTVDPTRTEEGGDVVISYAEHSTPAYQKADEHAMSLIPQAANDVLLIQNSYCEVCACPIREQHSCEDWRNLVVSGAFGRFARCVSLTSITTLDNGCTPCALIRFVKPQKVSPMLTDNAALVEKACREIGFTMVDDVSLDLNEDIHCLLPVADLRNASSLGDYVRVVKNPQKHCRAEHWEDWFKDFALCVAQVQGIQTDRNGDALLKVHFMGSATIVLPITAFCESTKQEHSSECLMVPQPMERRVMMAVFVASTPPLLSAKAIFLIALFIKSVVDVFESGHSGRASHHNSWEAYEEVYFKLFNSGYPTLIADCTTLTSYFLINFHPTPTGFVRGVGIPSTIVLVLTAFISLPGIVTHALPMAFYYGWIWGPLLTLLWQGAKVIKALRPSPPVMSQCDAYSMSAIWKSHRGYVIRASLYYLLFRFTVELLGVIFLQTNYNYAVFAYDGVGYFDSITKEFQQRDVLCIFEHGTQLASMLF